MERQMKREEGRKKEGLPSRKGKRRRKRKWSSFPLRNEGENSPENRHTSY